ncbi:MAG: hypothetical protein ACR2MY_14375, partial [Candidatus Dormibacteria bacterium]
AFAGIFSVSKVPVGAYSVAQFGPGQSNFALYSDGCVNILSNKLETIAGNTYVNECTLNPAGNGAFCTYTEGPSASPRLGASSGTATFGPYATLPTTVLSLQTVAGCRLPAAPAGTEFATGNIIKSPYEESPPAYAPPPNIPIANLGPATPTHSCRAHAGTAGNRSVNELGNDPNDCYDPGAYTTIGLGSPIANNLNSGVYHIYGDTTNSCYTSQTDINCASVLFGGNTLNANYNDVVHRCWTNPSLPLAGNFTAPCPDGFIDNPTSGLVDPRCAAAPGCPGVFLTPPAFALTPLATTAGGALDPAGLGTTYYVRVTALDGFGESLSTERSITVAAVPPGTGGIRVTLTGLSPRATSYNIYGPSLTPGTELQNGATFAALPLGQSQILTALQGSGPTYPVFDTSACPVGFCNIPNPGEHFGVTFVLEGKAGVCIGDLSSDGLHCDDTDANTVVMLSPFCGGGFSSQGSGAAATEACNPSGASSNDGSFVFYGPTQGTLRLGGKALGVTLGVTGVIDTPRAFLDIDEGRFHVVPGQVIVHNVDIDSVNLLDPLVYFGLGPLPPISVRLIQ